MSKIYKCAIYARVSTTGQVSSKDEDSVDRQVEMLKGLIVSKGGAENGWMFDDKNIFRDEGVSAKNLNRPAFRQMEEKIENGEINTILATRYDRLSRSVIDFLTFFEKMRKKKVEIVVLQGQCDTTNAQGVMTLTVLMALAQFSRQQTQMATKQAMIMLADKGRWRGGKAPFGFKLGSDLEDGEKGWLYLNPEQFIYVEQIFDLYIQYRSAGKVAEILNNQGLSYLEAYVSKREVQHSEHKFTKNIIYRILKDKIYLGTMVYNRMQRNEEGDIIKNNPNIFERDAIWKNELPHTIPIEKFNIVQELLEAKRKGIPGAEQVEHSYIFGPNSKEGLAKNIFINSRQVALYCNHCKQWFKSTSGHGRPSEIEKVKRYYYYHHQDRKKSATANCPIINIPCLELEKIIINRITHLIHTEDLFNNVVQKAEENQMNKINVISKQISAVQKKIKGLHEERIRKMKMCDSKDDFEKFIKPYLIEIDNEEKELNFNLKQLTDELQQYQENKIEAKSLRDKLKEIMNIMDLLDGKSIQMICKMLIESVAVTPGKTIKEPLEIEINLWGRLPELLNIPLSDLNDKIKLKNYLLPCSVQRNEWGG